MQMSPAALLAIICALAYVAAGADVESAGLNAVSLRRVRAAQNMTNNTTTVTLCCQEEVTVLSLWLKLAACSGACTQYPVLKHTHS